MAVVFENPLSGHLHWLLEFVQASDETKRAASAKTYYFNFVGCSPLIPDIIFITVLEYEF